ncbi:MAG TPA: ankyrin repeat domain-containing protein [Candidatus Babeliaceae bacterium]|nr:ankyrin repeat domain-containing protein [Candidatus Babeliaceae bacterium]
MVKIVIFLCFGVWSFRVISIPDNELILSAVFEGDYYEVQRLIKEGANVNGYDDWGRTPLSIACSEGLDCLVKYLLEHGANANTWDAMGYTPLHWAASEGCYEIAKMLLEKGACPNARNKNKATPLDCAVACGAWAIVELLKQYNQSLIIQRKKLSRLVNTTLP